MRRGPPAHMRSSLYIPIERSAPHALSSGHRLMLQTGLVRQTASGIYSLLPNGLRALEKLQKLIDREMQSVGGQKIAMPSLLPTSLWKQSGRWANAGREVFRLLDRKGEQFLLAPTHEEVVTDLIAHTVRSYRSLPIRLYQIGTKFRDEERPRLGLIRGREFIMKDMYSFDATVEAAHESYDAVLAAYRRLFTALKVPYMVAEADAGNIGGTRTHEFHAIAPVGEDKLLACPSCGYTANVEKAKGRMPPAKPVVISSESGLWSKLTSHVCVTAVLAEGSERVLGYVLMRAGQEANEVAVRAHFGDATFTLSPLKAPPSDAPPKGVRVLTDESIATLGADTAEAVQRWSVSSGAEAVSGVYRETQAGDGCVKCEEGKLVSHKGIELGHVFYLGTKYSAPLNAVLTSPTGENKPIEMGCYGLGLTRIISAVAETSNDSHGLVWPSVLAPYKAVVLAFPGKDPLANLEDEAQAVASQLTALPGMEGEVVYDDRVDLQPGARMKEAQFLGYPWMVILGRKWHSEQLLEIEERKESKKRYVKRSELQAYFDEAHSRL